MIPEADSLWWSSTPMHTSGIFAYGGFGLSHAHQPYSKGYWIIQGTPEQVHGSQLVPGLELGLELGLTRNWRGWGCMTRVST